MGHILAPLVMVQLALWTDPFAMWMYMVIYTYIYICICIHTLGTGIVTPGLVPNRKMQFGHRVTGHHMWSSHVYACPRRV
jgi:hypothetical protein